MIESYFFLPQKKKKKLMKNKDNKVEDKKCHIQAEAIKS